MIWYDLYLLSFYNIINAVYSLKLGETDANFGMISWEEAPAAEDQFDEEDEEATMAPLGPQVDLRPTNPKRYLNDTWMMTQHCYNSLICIIYLFDNIVCI